MGEGEGVGRVGSRCGIHYFALKYTNFIFLIVEMVVMDRFFADPGSALL